MSRTTYISAGCLAVLAGLALGKAQFLPAAWLLATGLVMLARRPYRLVAAVFILGLAAGWWRGASFSQHPRKLDGLHGQRVVIEASASSNAVYGHNKQLEFIAGQINLVQPRSESLAGSFRVSGFGLPMVYRGDVVRVSGKFYASAGSTQGRISYGQLELAGKNDSPVYQLSRKVAAGAQTALPEPAASFAMGILVGERTTMPQSIKDQLITVGLIHVVAVSGYNVTILSRAVARMRLGSKYQKLVMSLALIGLFVVITGFSPSIVRAAMVSGLSLWAWFYGRRISAVTLISFTAALTAMINPFYVWGDLGWYLSFLAFFGVLVIAPMIASRFKRRIKNLAMVVLETLSAEIMTLPLIMMSFGQLSLVSLVANALVVPLIPYAMLLSAVAAAAGAWLAPVAGWLAWPARWLLTYILDLVQLLSSVPSALLRVRISPAVMLGFYALVILFMLTMRKHQTAKNAIITDTEP